MSLAKPQERRQFGRLKTSYHGWIRVAGRPLLACVVRDLSVTGAGIELNEDCPLPNLFTLMIESVSFAGACHVRHRDGVKLGVEFASRGSQRHLASMVEAKEQSVRR